jgi:hypothetical protein
MRRYRFIVRRDNERLYDHLVRVLAHLEEIEVIVDRRAPVRRRGGGSFAGERRHAERRANTRVDEDLRLYGWSFIKTERP